MAVRHVARTLLTLVTAALLGAGGAFAAEVSTSSYCETHGGGKGCSFVTTANYRAAPGEANDLNVTREPGAFVFTDTVPVDPGAGCERRAETVAVCRAIRGEVALGDGADAATALIVPEPTGSSFYVALRVDAGDGPDRVRVRNAFAFGGAGDDVLTGASLSGGPGDDVLTGTDFQDYLDGGTGRDEIRSGDGNDTLLGDGDTNTLEPVEPAHDLLDGGAGTDSTSYGGHAVPVEVRLADDIGGSAGEDDQLIGIENAYGGRDADRLVGDDGPNHLHGYTGYDRAGIDHDVIVGLAGDDDLSGGSGHDSVDGGPGNDHVRGGIFDDTIVGGPGDDVLEGDHGTDRFSAGDGDDLLYVGSSDGGVEEVACGGGADRALNPVAGLLDPDCELVVIGAAAGGPRIPAYPSGAGSGRLVFKFACPQPRACTGRLRLRVAGQPRGFFERRWSTRNGRVRLVVTVPPEIRARPGERLPLVARLEMKHGRKPEYNPRYGGIWSFDLLQVRGFER